MSIDNALTRLFSGIALGVGLLLLLFISPHWFFAMVIGALFFYSALAELPRLLPPSQLLFWVVLCCYLLFPFAALIWFDQQVARTIIAIPFLLVALFDSASYVTGKLFGNHKLAPRVSPGKTWEGFFGGFLTVLITVLLVGYWHYQVISIPHAIFFAFLFCFVALSGDLFESWLKRSTGLKDSGSLIPGHGGLLDRIDALLVVIPFFVSWYYLFLV